MTSLDRTVPGDLREIPRTWIAATLLAAFLASGAAAGNSPPAKDTIEEAARADRSVFDEIWSLATLYQDEDNPYVQEIKLRGRYHGQYHWLDSAQGKEDDWEDRRSRIGVDAKFLDQFAFRGDVQGADGFDPVYNGIVDFFVKWTPSKEFSLTAGKQKPGIGHYDWFSPSTHYSTFERSQIFGQLRIDRALGIQAEGRAGNWLYRSGIYSNDIDAEFGNLAGGAAFSGGIGYDFTEAASLDKAEWRFDYLHSDIREGSTVLNRYENLFSSTVWLADGRWSFIAEGFAGAGYSDDVAGFFLLPAYDLVPDRLQAVGRYAFYTGDGPDSVIAQSRYERRAPELAGGGQGDAYHAFYSGLQYFLYGDKLKLMAGAEYATLDGGGNGGDFDGWTFLAGVRFFF